MRCERQRREYGLPADRRSADAGRTGIQCRQRLFLRKAPDRLRTESTQHRTPRRHGGVAVFGTEKTRCRSHRTESGSAGFRRPWADEDPDDSNHKKAIDGANDGASGVGVLLEAARIFGQQNPETGIDILFVDSEDYGTEGDDTSWALGARYFAENPIKPGYRPAQAILLDMVGGKGAVFPAEYFSRQAAPGLDDAFRAAAAKPDQGHVELIKQGIPAIDIIDYRVNEGFCPTWHTMADNIDNIDKESLRAVGETLLHFIYR